MNEDRPAHPETESVSRTTSRDSGEDRISASAAHRILASERRRDVLSFLSCQPEEDVSVDEIVASVAGQEHPNPGPETHRSRIAIDLHHVHLPKLADAGVVSFDPVAETVSYEPSETIETFLVRGDALERETE